MLQIFTLAGVLKQYLLSELFSYESIKAIHGGDPPTLLDYFPGKAITAAAEPKLSSRQHIFRQL